MTVTLLVGAGEDSPLSEASRGGRQVDNCENHYWDSDVKPLTHGTVGENSALTLVDNGRGRRRRVHRHHHIVNSHCTKQWDLHAGQNSALTVAGGGGRWR